MTNTKPSVAALREALDFWKRATDELDQAHAILRDLGMHQIANKGYHKLDAEDVVNQAIFMAETLESYTCDECGEAIMKHPTADCGEWVE